MTVTDQVTEIIVDQKEDLTIHEGPAAMSVSSLHIRQCGLAMVIVVVIVSLQKVGRLPKLLDVAGTSGRALAMAPAAGRAFQGCHEQPAPCRLGIDRKSVV